MTTLQNKSWKTFSMYHCSFLFFSFFWIIYKYSTVGHHNLDYLFINLWSYTFYFIFYCIERSSGPSVSVVAPHFATTSLLACIRASTHRNFCITLKVLECVEHHEILQTNCSLPLFDLEVSHDPPVGMLVNVLLQRALIPKTGAKFQAHS